MTETLQQEKVDFNDNIDLSEKNGFKTLNSDKGKKEFQKILSILNRYYSKLSIDKSESQKFRENFANLDIEQIDIKLKSIGENQYLCTCTDLKNNHRDTWLHIDGIQEERDSYSKQGNLNHQVFEIICLTDIYLDKI